jgi:glycosyltransferase involved in cell wall biosynthesis
VKVLQISAHFYPNIGGVETHLNDLASVLIKKGWEVTVVSYKPLTTKVSSKIFEKTPFLTIIRIPWLPGLFYKLIHYPFLEFLYLLPGLFLITPLVMIFSNANVVHAHGLVAGFIGVFWGKLFGKKVIIATHSIYGFPKKGVYTSFVRWIFDNADYCMGLSKQAVNEIQSLGIDKKKIKKFTYWIDLKKFKKVNRAKAILGWKGRFIVLFVGRLITEKGLGELLESAKDWDKNIKLKIIGSGPLERLVREAEHKLPNVDFIEGVESNNLPIYYSGSDLLIVPSVSEEGFGRVILEALACGTPVIGARRGAIIEAMDESVGRIIDVSGENIRQVNNFFYTQRDALKKLAKNTRKFAERRFSEENAESIIKLYQG